MINFPANVLIEMKQHLEEEKAKVDAQIADLKQQDPFSDASRSASTLPANPAPTIR